MTCGYNGIDVANNANIAAMNPPIEQLVSTEGSVWIPKGKKTEIIKLNCKSKQFDTIYILLDLLK